MEEMIAEFSRDQIIEYACNDVARKKSIEMEAKMANDRTTQRDPCVKALEDLEVDSDAGKDALESLSNRDTCANKVGDVLDGMNVEGFLQESEGFFWVAIPFTVGGLALFGLEVAK